jgi:hypothetical protein
MTCPATFAFPISLEVSFCFSLLTVALRLASGKDHDRQ